MSVERTGVVTGHCRWPVPGRINGRQQTASGLCRAAPWLSPLLAPHARLRPPQVGAAGAAASRCVVSPRRDHAPGRDRQPTATRQFQDARIVMATSVTSGLTPPGLFQKATAAPTSHNCQMVQCTFSGIRSKRDDGEDISSMWSKRVPDDEAGCPRGLAAASAALPAGSRPPLVMKLTTVMARALSTKAGPMPRRNSYSTPRSPVAW